MYRLGKQPARKDAVSFKLRDYVSTVKVPSKAGHQSLVSHWGMLGNDQYGDCVLAGAGHETMLWNQEGGYTGVVVDTPEALLAYHDITGFNADDPNTDNGTDVQVAASWRRKTGILDTNSKRHKVLAYLALVPGNTAQLKQAVYQFGAAGIGIQFPSSAMDQFNQGKPWTVTDSDIEGGHYIPAVAYDSKYIYVVTWGKIQKMAWSFYKKYCDEALVYLSPDMFNKGVTPENFNLIQLESDLKTL